MCSLVRSPRRILLVDIFFSLRFVAVVDCHLYLLFAITSLSSRSEANDTDNGDMACNYDDGNVVQLVEILQLSWFGIVEADGMEFVVGGVESHWEAY